MLSSSLTSSLASSSVSVGVVVSSATSVVGSVVGFSSSADMIEWVVIVVGRFVMKMSCCLQLLLDAGETRRGRGGRKGTEAKAQVESMSGQYLLLFYTLFYTNTTNGSHLDAKNVCKRFFETMKCQQDF